MWEAKVSRDVSRWRALLQGLKLGVQRMNVEKSLLLISKSRRWLERSETPLRAVKFAIFLVSIISFKHAAF